MMKPLFDIPISNFNWQSNTNNFPHLSSQIQSWLFETGSLTQRAINYCESKGCSFNVKVLSQEEKSPAASEARKLNMQPDEIGVIREVLLNCGENSIIFARTIIPFSTMTGQHQQLKMLGNKPLGEYLFAQADMTRAPLEISFHENQSNKQKFWARRSVFSLNKKPLLVYEVFLSQISH